MFEEPDIITGIELGTAKICVVVGERTAGGGVNIIGVGQATSRGVRKGEIINPQEVEEDLREAVAQAELMADREIRNVQVGVTGGHIKSVNNRGFHRVVAADYEITPEDVADVVSNAQAINLPTDNSVLHTIRQHFTVGGEDGVTDPAGMHGAQLEVDLHVIHGKTTRLHNTVRLVKSTSLVVESVVFNALASGLAVLTPEQKDLGALVIDLGAGTTEYVVYSEGIIRHSGVLAIGGDHVTNDLAYGLRISLRQAELLKKENGSALGVEAERGKTISIHDEPGQEVKRVKVEHVQAIMSARLEEIFKIIADDLAETGLEKYLRAGVFLCGGGARTNGILALAERVFQMAASAGHASAISGQAKALDQPEFATAIGLVKYGAMQPRQPVTRKLWWLQLKDWIRRWVTFLR